jgi:hypothetical protein
VGNGAAGELSQDDRLWTLDERHVRVLATSFQVNDRAGVLFSTIEVAVAHTFAVSRLSVIVHNHNYVYRAMTDTRMASLNRGQGINAKNPRATYTAKEQVEQGNKLRTQFISTTTSSRLALHWAANSWWNSISNGGVVRIDLNELEPGQVQTLTDDWSLSESMIFTHRIVAPLGHLNVQSHRSCVLVVCAFVCAFFCVLLEGYNFARVSEEVLITGNIPNTAISKIPNARFRTAAMATMPRNYMTKPGGNRPSSNNLRWTVN